MPKKFFENANANANAVANACTWEYSIRPGPKLPYFKTTKFIDSVRHLSVMFTLSLRDQHHFVLDGSPLMLIYLGTPEEIAESIGKNNYCRVVVGKQSWSACCVRKFDVDEFMALPSAEQDEVATRFVEKALKAAAKIVGVDARPITQTAKLLRDSNYRPRFPIESLACENQKAKLRAQVLAEVKRGGIEWQVEVRDLNGCMLAQSAIPTDKPLDAAELKPHLETGRFSLKDKNNRAKFSLRLEKQSND